MNNINKEDALKWWRDNRRRYQSGLADLIYRVTVCGEEYADGNDRGMYMSYICRVYNITAYEASRKQNSIKNRYKEYRENSDVRRVIADIIRKYPNGFTSEYPRFDDLLKDYYIQDRVDEPYIE